jgi:hypothetical protein
MSIRSCVGNRPVPNMHPEICVFARSGADAVLRREMLAFATSAGVVAQPLQLRSGITVGPHHHQATNPRPCVPTIASPTRGSSGQPCFSLSEGRPPDPLEQLGEHQAATGHPPNLVGMRLTSGAAQVEDPGPGQTPSGCRGSAIALLVVNALFVLVAVGVIVIGAELFVDARDFNGLDHFNEREHLIARGIIVALAGVAGLAMHSTLLRLTAAGLRQIGSGRTELLRGSAAVTVVVAVQHVTVPVYSLVVSAVVAWMPRESLGTTAGVVVWALQDLLAFVSWVSLASWPVVSGLLGMPAVGLLRQCRS